MRIVLTGATGFIGGHLVPLLVRDHQVFCLLRPGTGAPAGAHAIEIDLTHPLEFDRLPNAVDAVVHLALPRNFKDFPEAVDDLFQINIRATADLLTYARRSGAGQFILASTGNMKAPDYRLGIGGPVVPPHDYYSVSKAAAELLSRPFQTFFDVFVPNLFFPYGAGQTGKTIPRLVETIRHGDPVTLAGGGGGDILSLVHVADAAELLRTAIQDRWSGHFDVAAREQLSVREIAETIGRRIGRTPKFQDSADAAKNMTADLGQLEIRYDLAKLCGFEAGFGKSV